MTSMRTLTLMLCCLAIAGSGTLVADPGPSAALQEGMPVRLGTLELVSSATAQENQRLRLEVVEDVVIEGRVVLARGAAAFGTVTRAARRKGFGRNGRLEFTIETVEAVDGRNIRLRASKTHRGRDRYVAAGVVTLLTGPFGALVKGKDIEIPTGTEYVLYLDSEQQNIAGPGRIHGSP